MDDGQVKTRRSRANRNYIRRENYRQIQKITGWSKILTGWFFSTIIFFEKLVGQNFSPPGNFFDQRFESGWVIGWVSGWVNGWVIFPFPFYIIEFNSKSLSEFNSKSLFFELGSRVVIILGWLDLDFVFESSYCLIIYIWAHGFGFDSRLR